MSTLLVERKDETGAAELEPEELEDPDDELEEEDGVGAASGMLGLTCCNFVSTLMFLTIMIFWRNCVFLGPADSLEEEDDDPSGVMLDDIGGASPGRLRELEPPSCGEAESEPLEPKELLPEPDPEPEPEPEPDCGAITMDGLMVSDSESLRLVLRISHVVGPESG